MEKCNELAAHSNGKLLIKISPPNTQQNFAPMCLYSTEKIKMGTAVIFFWL